MGKSEFVRMRNPDLSGISGSGMRRNPGNHLGEVRIWPDAKWWIRIFSDIPEVTARIFQKHPGVWCEEIRAITTEISEKIRMRNGEKSGFACCLFLLNKVFGHFRMCESGFIRMRNAEKSGQSPRGSRNLSGCEIRICPDAIYKKKKNKSIAALKKPPRGPSAETAF